MPAEMTAPKRLKGQHPFEPFLANLNFPIPGQQIPLKVALSEAH